MVAVSDEYFLYELLELVAPASAVKKVGEQSVESAADQIGH